MAKNIFNTVEMARVDTNRFDLSHDVKMSFKMGGLYPTTALECMPGDNFNIRLETLLRFAPLVAPVMHHVKVTQHFFFVPNRILWPNWEKWITNELDVQHPFVSLSSTGISNVQEKSLADYLGIPPVSLGPLDNVKVNPFPIAAYYRIWNEYYRDQNLQQEMKGASLVDGNNTSVYNTLSPLPNDPLPFYVSPSSVLRRAWEHDYFTSCLPFAQKGDSVAIPLGEVGLVYDATGGNTVIRRASDGTVFSGQSPNDLENNLAGFVRTGNTGNAELNLDVTANHYGEVTATDIASLRRAFRLQEWLEKNARGGTRYIEHVRAHFGVSSSDKRMSRPEYIGGSKGSMAISEVLSTADTGAAPIGEMAGRGISASGSGNFSYYCEEHGWIIGLINVQPISAYMQGLHRSLGQRFDPLDYPWPTFALIGEQEVLNKEIYLEGDGENDEIFGYIPRYSELRYLPSRVSGEMRSSFSQWHMARDFGTRPALNAEFIACDPSDAVSRCFAVTDPSFDHLYGHLFHQISAVRKLPMFGTPTI